MENLKSENEAVRLEFLESVGARSHKGSEIWTDKYEPQHYTDLLTDEVTC